MYQTALLLIFSKGEALGHGILKGEALKQGAGAEPLPAGGPPHHPFTPPSTMPVTK